MWGVRGLVGWRGWDVESPHILADSFRANKNGCRVSWRKDGKCGGGEEAGTRGLKEGGDGEEESGRGKYRGQSRTVQGRDGGGSEGVRRIER